MQRYRVNYGLLVGLVLGVLAFFGALYGLYRLQDSNKATRYLSRADEYEQSGELREAWQQLLRYTNLRKKDTAARERFANLSADLVGLEDVTLEDIQKAFAILERTVREQPDNAKLRRRFVDLLLSLGASKEALPHLVELLNSDPENRELQGFRAKCLFDTNDAGAFNYAAGLVGFNPITGKIEEGKAKAPDAVDVYSRVAAVLRGDRRQPAQGDAVMEQMLKANPKSARAYLLHGVDRMVRDKLDEAEKDLQHALELDPKNADVMVATSQLYLSQKKTKEAEALLIKLVEEHPDLYQPYQYLASLALMGDPSEKPAEVEGQPLPTRMTDEKFDKSMEWLSKGIAATKGGAAQFLKFTRARLQLDRGDQEGAKESIAELEKDARFDQLKLSFLKARQLINEEKYYAASQEFAKLQTAFTGGDLGEELNYLLGLCYEKLGQYEKAKESYNLVLQANPKNQLAILGTMRVNETIGSSDSSGESQSIYTQLQREIDKPEASQDWVEFDRRLVAYAKANRLDEATIGLLRSEVLMRRKNFPEARKMLSEIYQKNPDNMVVRRSAVRLVAADPEGGVAKALGLLEGLFKKFGDKPILRLDKADLLLLAGDENLKEQLFALTEGIDEWSNSEKVQLWTGLATAFQRGRDNESAGKCLDETIKLSPTDLASLMRRFSMALESNDDVGMTSAQEQLLEVVGSKENANWMYTEAQRLVSLIQRGQVDRTELKTVNSLLDRTIADRPDWSEPYLLRSQVRLLENDLRGAVAQFDLAAGKTRLSGMAIYQYCKLLAAMGRYKDSRRIAESLNETVRMQVLGQEYAEILYNTGSLPESFSAADKVIAADPKNPAKQYWYGQFNMLASRNTTMEEAARKKLMDQGVKAIGAAVELNDTSQEMWLARVGALAASGDRNGAENAICGAQLALPEDESSLMLARCYEVMGRWFDAENLYKDTIATVDKLRAGQLAEGGPKPPLDLRFTRFLAQFYLGAGYKRADSQAKAVPLINSILKAGAEEDVPPTDPHLQWARRTGAQLLAATKDYQNLLTAEKLLTSNVVQGRLNEEDKLLLAGILGQRPEPISRSKAVQLLEEVKLNRDLPLEPALQLGQLYFALDRWDRCRQQMINLIGKNAENPLVRANYITMLLQRGAPSDVDEAAKQLRRLVELAPNSIATMELVARVSNKAGRPEEAQRALQRLLPPDLSTLKPEQLPTVKYVAALLVDLKNLPPAEKLFRALADKGGPEQKLELADFVGRYGELGESFDMIEAQKGVINDVDRIRVALGVLRTRRDEVGDQFDSRLTQLIDRAIQEEPDMLTLQMERAESLEITGKISEATKLYRELLKRSDLEGAARAIVLNNLSYLLATTEDSSANLEEALKAIDEAASILGPVSDILDSKAVVLIQAKRYDEAIAAMNLSVTDNPTPSKYFHKAYAHFRAGQNDLTRTAWKKAEELGLDRAQLGVIEKKQYDEIKGQLQKLGLVSASGK